MVKIDKENRKVIIEFRGDVNDFVELHKALIMVLQTAQGQSDLSKETATVLTLLHEMVLESNQITEGRKAA
jgi:hypothetical protein